MLQWYQDLDPLPAAIDWATVAPDQYQVRPAMAKAAAAGGPARRHPHGLDFGMRRWGAQDDYSRKHWADALEPLTFS